MGPCDIVKEISDSIKFTYFITSVEPSREVLQSMELAAYLVSSNINFVIPIHVLIFIKMRNIQISCV